MTLEIQVEPKLDRPGAGLPPLEWAVAKFIIFPIRFATTDQEKAINEFVIESKMILGLVNKMDKARINERCLIPRLTGLEDSSRFWSVAMTLEHLVIVGEGMRKLVVDLSAGKTDAVQRGTADVKPSSSANGETAIKSFEEMRARLVADCTNAAVNSFPSATHPHPWFGPLNAMQWLAFGAPHLAIHRKQIEKILDGLSKN